MSDVQSKGSVEKGQGTVKCSLDVFASQLHAVRFQSMSEDETLVAHSIVTDREKIRRRIFTEDFIFDQQWRNVFLQQQLTVSDQFFITVEIVIRWCTVRATELLGNPRPVDPTTVKLLLLASSVSVDEDSIGDTSIQVQF